MKNNGIPPSAQQDSAEDNRPLTSEERAKLYDYIVDLASRRWKTFISYLIFVGIVLHALNPFTSGTSLCGVKSEYLLLGTFAIAYILALATLMLLNILNLRLHLVQAQVVRLGLYPIMHIPLDKADKLHSVSNLLNITIVVLGGAWAFVFWAILYPIEKEAAFASFILMVLLLLYVSLGVVHWSPINYKYLKEILDKEDESNERAAHWLKNGEDIV
jgi:hypothetical protein